jgi:hypothetical protein
MFNGSITYRIYKSHCLINKEAWLLTGVQQSIFLQFTKKFGGCNRASLINLIVFRFSSVFSEQYNSPGQIGLYSNFKLRYKMSRGKKVELMPRKGSYFRTLHTLNSSNGIDTWNV